MYRRAGRHLRFPGEPILSPNWHQVSPTKIRRLNLSPSFGPTRIDVLIYRDLQYVTVCILSGGVAKKREAGES